MHRPIRAVALACAATLVPAAAAQAAPPPADSVIVTLKPGTPGAAARDVLSSGREVGRIHGTQARVLRVPDPAAAVERLRRNPNVAEAEVDVMLEASAIPNDPRFGSLYGMDRIDAPEAWDALGLSAFPATGGAKVGIVDTGIRAGHEDLTGRTTTARPPPRARSTRGARTATATARTSPGRSRPPRTTPAASPACRSTPAWRSARA